MLVILIGDTSYYISRKMQQLFLFKQMIAKFLNSGSSMDFSRCNEQKRVKGFLIKKLFIITTIESSYYN